MPTIYKEVDVDLDDFDIEDLVEELHRRNQEAFVSESSHWQLHEIYNLRRQGLPYDHLMDDYIYQVLGRIR